VREAIEKLRSLVNSEDSGVVKEATEDLQKKFYDISAKLYQQDKVDPNDPSNYQDDRDNNGDTATFDRNGGGEDFVNTDFKDEQ